jgi:hypothetical protein
MWFESDHGPIHLKVLVIVCVTRPISTEFVYIRYKHVKLMVHGPVAVRSPKQSRWVSLGLPMTVVSRDQVWATLPTQRAWSQ